MISWEEIKYRLTAPWRMGDLSPFDQTVLVWIFMSQAALRGVDYIDHDPTGNSSDHFDILYRAYDHRILGWVFIATVVFFIVGAVFKKHLYVWISHAVLTLLYFIISCAVLLYQFLYSSDIIFRAPGIFIISFSFHLFFMIRMGAMPLKDSESVTSDEQSIIVREE